MSDVNNATRPHALHIYEEDAVLATTAASFLEPAFPNEQAILALATRPHLAAIEQRLRTSGHDVDGARRTGRYLALDAEQLLPKLMHNGLPSKRAFDVVVANPVSALAGEFGEVRAFGELVNLLWREGKRTAALKLEDLWNELLGYQPLSLICGYRLRTVGGRTGERVDDIVTTHDTILGSNALLQDSI